MLAANERVINDLLPTNEGLTKIEDTVMLLEPLEHATKLLSASSYPTIADVKLVFSAIQEFLEEYIEDDDLLQYELAGSINTKLDEYRSIIDKSTIIATILNPQAKLSNFQPGSESSSAISNLCIKFQEYLDEYSIIQELNPPQTNSQYNYRKYFQQLKNHKSNNQSPQPSTLERPAGPRTRTRPGPTFPSLFFIELLKTLCLSYEPPSKNTLSGCLLAQETAF
ncbi:22457_t:CDS:2, partial [Entrophospora sp. SA101]